MSFQKFIYSTFYKPFLQRKLNKDVSLNLNGLRLWVKKGVFHPKYFFSTGFMYEFIEKLNLRKKTFLEIGSGSGMLSLSAYKKGAEVTCIDIDENAVETTRYNFDLNFKNSKAVILQSDLFENLPKKTFDVIVINPPYFFGEVKSNDQYAWYCGPNGEYFENLFCGLGSYMHAKSNVYIILAENCEIERIQTIAKKHGILFVLLEEKKIKWEKNFIFSLQSNAYGTNCE